MAEYCGDLETTRAFNVHEETIRACNEPLELVGSGLLFGGWVEEIDGHLVDKL